MEGFEVVGEATDGAEAIACVKALRPEIVLLDVQLPDRDGFSICAEVTGNCNIPDVVLTSSRDGQDYGPLIARSGALGFIPKAELSGDALRELLGRR
jgi:DNA-binding NarL/FixJ family response regulator